MNFSVDIPPQTYSPGCFRAWTIPPPFSHGVGHSLLPTLPFGALVVTLRTCYGALQIVVLLLCANLYKAIYRQRVLN